MPRRPLSGRMTPSRNRSNRIASLVALLLSALLLVACSSQTLSDAAGTASRPPEAASGGTSYPLTITDARGKSVTIRSAPKRVALGTTYPYTLIAEMIQTLGVADRVVGATDGTIRSAWPRFVTKLASVGDTPVNVEAITAMRPDLMLANVMDAATRAQLESQGIPVILVEGTDIARLPDEFRQLGKVLDVNDAAGRIATFLEQQRKAVTDVSAAIRPEDKPRVYLETTRPSGSASTYKTYTRGHSTNAIIEAAGGVNLAADLVGGRSADVDVNAEWILGQNPQVVIITNSTGFGFTPNEAKLREVYKQFVSRPGFSDIDAVKNGRVHMLTSNIFYGTRFPVGLQYVGGWLHPELFKVSEAEKTHQEILTQFYDATLSGVWAYVPG